MINAIAFFRLSKVNAKTGEFRAELANELPDTSGEVCDVAASLPFFDALEKRCLAESNGKKVAPLREMHQLVAAGNVVAFEKDPAGRTIGMLGKVTNPDSLAKVLEGTLCGVSMGGKKQYVGLDAITGLRKYVARPQEVSLVDLGCLQNTGIEMLNAAGGLTVEREDGTVEQRPFLAKAAAPDPLLEATPIIPQAELDLRRAWRALAKAAPTATDRAAKRALIEGWKAGVDAAMLPPTDGGDAALAKHAGFCIAADVVRLVGELSYLSDLQKEEEAREGDVAAGALCDALDLAIAALGDVAMAMLDEELGELPANEATDAVGDEPTGEAEPMANAADAMRGLKGRVQRMHNMAVEMGAACAPMTDCTKATTAAETPTAEEDPMKPEELKELAKAVHGALNLDETLAKAIGAALGLEQEDGALTKAIGAAVTPKLDDLAKAVDAKVDALGARIEALEKQPTPDKGVVRAVPKESDADVLAKAAENDRILDDLAKNDPLALVRLNARSNGYAITTTSGVMPHNPA